MAGSTPNSGSGDQQPLSPELVDSLQHQAECAETTEVKETTDTTQSVGNEPEVASYCSQLGRGKRERVRRTVTAGCITRPSLRGKLAIVFR